MIECPNHFGSFDCTPFCVVCEGAQEFSPAFPLAIEYECWTCSEWHSETSPSLSDLQEFLESSGARYRLA